MRSDLRINIELSKCGSSWGGPRAVDATGAAARLAAAVVVTSSAAPDAASPGRREHDRVTVSTWKKEATSQITIVYDPGIESWIDVLLAVVYECNFSAEDVQFGQNTRDKSRLRQRTLSRAQQGY